MFLRYLLSKLQGKSQTQHLPKDIQFRQGTNHSPETAVRAHNTYTYYNHLLQTARMKQGETVNDFYDHINVLLGGAETALKEEIGATYTPDMLRPCRIRPLTCLLEGCQPTSAARWIARSQRTSKRALDEAIRLEKRMAAHIIPDTRAQRLPPRGGLSRSRAGDGIPCLLPQRRSATASPRCVSPFPDCDELCLQSRKQQAMSPSNGPTKQKIQVPARTRTVVQLKLITTALRDGYLPRIDTGNPDVFLGEGLVRNEGNTCKVLAINSSNSDVEFGVDPVEIIPFEYVVQDFESDSPSEVEDRPVLNAEQRNSQIREALDLNPLNPEEEKASVLALVRDYPELFLLPGDPLPCTNLVYHEIPLENEIPINTKQYRHPPVHKEVIQKDIDKRLREGIIEPSASPMNSPIWIVPKKPGPDGTPKWRIVIDFRELNKKTIGDAYPLPNIADIMDQLGGASYFSTFDLASGFHQIPMKEDDKWKTAFSTLNGHFQYKRMPMGLKNAPATFQRLMDKVLRGLQNIEMLVYLDDIIVYAKDLKEHDSKVRRLFDRLRDARLVLEPAKVHFLRKEVGFLGHIVSERGVEMDPKKISVMTEFPQPKTVRNVRQFLGMAGYYRRFIQDFSKIAKPLHDLTKKGVKFEWKDAHEDSFQTLKTRLTTAPILIFPDFDKPFTLTTDASDLAIAAVLSQEKDGFDHPVGYLSRVLNKAEVNYSTTEKECLAALYAMYHYRPYLLGRPFTLVADHEPLNWMHNRKDPGQRLMRWMFKFTDYQYTFKYKPGKENVVADCLSRNPLNDTPEAEINQRLPLLRVMMYGRKKEAPEKKVAKPRSNSPVPKSYTRDPRKPSKPVGETRRKANTTGEEESCVALRTRSKVNSRSNPLVPPGAPVAARVDTGLKKRAGKAFSLRLNATISEDSECEKPPLVDSRYSGLRKDEDYPAESPIGEGDLEASDGEASAEEAQETELRGHDNSHKLTHAIILTSAPTTDEVTNTSSAEDTTEVVATALSEDELLKAAAEIDISQRILESRAYEAEDVPAERDADVTAALERSCISDGTSIDDVTREYLDSLDPYDEVRNTDKTLQDRVEKLIRDTQAKVGQEQNASTASDDTEGPSLREGETLIVSGSNRPAINERGTEDTPMSKSTPMTTRAARTSLPPQKLMDIPEGAETTPVVLNFSQPSTPDAPIFFPIPLAEGPLNKYILEHNPTSRITPSDYSEYSPSGPQIRIAGNIVASREALTYRSDNYITFVSQDSLHYRNEDTMATDERKVVGYTINEENTSRHTPESRHRARRNNGHETNDIPPGIPQQNRGNILFPAHLLDTSTRTHNTGSSTTVSTPNTISTTKPINTNYTDKPVNCPNSDQYENKQ
ncbi:unnamed protein product, partial [Trichogramma brassicae]